MSQPSDIILPADLDDDTRAAAAILYGDRPITRRELDELQAAMLEWAAKEVSGE